ncbi:hypothetical protein ES332_D03G119800v1 [Gossypium tomentosum]|uniref:Uncharacterized protein n=1 Tax=Gossypium tomentosum TaxID=34277 RepID=A0A5D2LLY1_GOSTO|nr:hypothetical protein ES332_D03G119800v1 [Gossypium tomentosum]
MEKALTKVGSFWISKKAKEELSAVSNTVEEKAKWILNKLKAFGGCPPRTQPSAGTFSEKHNMLRDGRIEIKAERVYAGGMRSEVQGRIGGEIRKAGERHVIEGEVERDGRDENEGGGVG